MAPIPYPLNPKNDEYTVNLLNQAGRNIYEKSGYENSTSWHTATWFDILAGNGIIQIEYTYRVNVEAIKSKYNATAITLNSVNLKCAQQHGGLVTSDTIGAIIVDGILISAKNLEAGGLNNWIGNTISTTGPLDLTDKKTLDIIIGVKLFGGSPYGYIDWYFGALKLEINVNTPFEFYSVYIQCTMPDVAPDGVRVQINEVVMDTNLQGLAGPFNLSSGSYVAYANATKMGSTYVGSVKFSVPYAQIPVINLQKLGGGLQLPWWWYIPVLVVVGVGGSVALASVTRRPKAQPPPVMPPIIVVR